MKTLPLSQVYQLLEPGPVVLLSTFSRGQSDVMTQSWHLMLEFEPPLVGVVVSDRSHSFRALKLSNECVLNIPDRKLLPAVIGCGNTSGRQVDKFEKFSLNPTPGKKVQAPLIQECFASLECRVKDTRLVKSYCFFVLEVVQAWKHSSWTKTPETLHHCGKGLFMTAGKRIQTKSRMK